MGPEGGAAGCRGKPAGDAEIGDGGAACCGIGVGAGGVTVSEVTSSVGTGLGVDPVCAPGTRLGPVAGDNGAGFAPGGVCCVLTETGSTVCGADAAVGFCTGGLGGAGMSCPETAGEGNVSSTCPESSVTAPETGEVGPEGGEAGGGVGGTGAAIGCELRF